MNVANKPVIRKLTLRSLKAAKTRNIIAVLAIALTAVLFTSVFTIGGNMLGAIQGQTMRQVGTTAHGGLKYLTAEQYEHFKQSPLTKDISYTIILARAENTALNDIQCEIRYGENKAADWEFSKPTVGKMPQAANEIACSAIMLDALGVTCEIGASVPLEFTVGGKKYAEDFSLVGYWPGDKAMGGQQVWLSREYVNSVLAESTLSESDFAGKIFADVWFSNALNIEGKMQRLIAERGYAADEIDYGVNWAYATSEIDPLMAAIAAFILALILLSGYLIIYSIFAISVTADIKFYGLLKTLGATGRQIRRVVRGQALALWLIGMPLGLLLGYACGNILTPLVLSMMTSSTDASAGNVNPLIFAFAALFSLTTVFISCRKPGKTAARVSPVEAVKYSEVTEHNKRKSKRTRKVSPLTMALANITRNKRKLCMVTLSLSLSLVLLNAIVSATQSFDLDEYVSKSIVGDFAVADYRLFRSSPGTVDFNGADDALLSEMKERGATEVSNVYYHYFGLPDITATQVYGVGDMQLRNFSSLGYDKLRSGDYAIVSRYVLQYSETPTVIPKVGEKITLTNSNGSAREFEVVELVDEYPFNISARMRFGNSLDVIIADNVFLDFYGETTPLQTNIKAENTDEFEAWLKEYTTNVNADIAYMSRPTLKAEFDGLQRMYAALGGGLAAILALIGVLNFVNAVIASIFSRRREFAMLQSIGMTGVQLRKTLFFEGAAYTALTAAFTLTIGLGCGWLIMRLIAGQVWFFKESFTALPSIICLPLLLVVCAAAPIVCYGSLNRSSVVERLRVE
ncbi:efflux ABC transporter permease [Clostridia bacterium]|nr:efflux ABC transporter permease [Clostridia bacterium]